MPDTKLSDDQCHEVNKTTLLEYGYAVLACVNWSYLDAKRLIGLTVFAVNVGKDGACGSHAVGQINVDRAHARGHPELELRRRRVCARPAEPLACRTATVPERLPT